MYDFEKTLLAAYNTMERVTEEMDRLFLSAATGSVGDPRPCEVIANSLIGMSERKAKLLYIRKTVRDCLLKVPVEERKFLAYKYLGVRSADVEKIFGTRLYHRRQVKALFSFKKAFSAEVGDGYDEFMSEALAFAFIAGVYDVFVGKEKGIKLPSSCYRATKDGKAIAFKKGK